MEESLNDIVNDIIGDESEANKQRKKDFQTILNELKLVKAEIEQYNANHDIQESFKKFQISNENTEDMEFRMKKSKNQNKLKEGSVRYTILSIQNESTDIEAQRLMLTGRYLLDQLILKINDYKLGLYYSFGIEGESSGTEKKTYKNFQISASRLYTDMLTKLDQALKSNENAMKTSKARAAGLSVKTNTMVAANNETVNKMASSAAAYQLSLSYIMNTYGEEIENAESNEMFNQGVTKNWGRTYERERKREITGRQNAQIRGKNNFPGIYIGDIALESDKYFSSSEVNFGSLNLVLTSINQILVYLGNYNNIEDVDPYLKEKVISFIQEQWEKTTTKDLVDATTEYIQKIGLGF